VRRLAEIGGTCWLDTTCYRDLQQVSGGRCSGELARRVLEAVAQGPDGTLAEAAADLRVDARRVRSHLEALEALFVLHRLDAHPAGAGKSRFLLFDAGVAGHLGAPEASRRRIWALNECLAQHQLRGEGRPRVTSYRSAKGSRIDLVVEQGGVTTGYLLAEDAAPGTYQLRAAHAFCARVPGARVVVLAPSTNRGRDGARVEIWPWEGVA
jgi:hypothetical protein